MFSEWNACLPVCISIFNGQWAGRPACHDSLCTSMTSWQARLPVCISIFNGHWAGRHTQEWHFRLYDTGETVRANRLLSKTFWADVYQCNAVQNVFVIRRFIRNQAGTLEKIRFGKTTRLILIAVKKLWALALAWISCLTNTTVLFCRVRSWNSRSQSEQF